LQSETFTFNLQYFCIKYSGLVESWECCYYRTATGAEIDLVLQTPDKEIWALEIKRNIAPKLTRGFYEACKDIKATDKWVLYSNNDRYPLPDGVEERHV
jgi:uncharacterized protein